MLEQNSLDINPGVTIIGMGFVGLTLGVFMAGRGLRVYGIENNFETHKMLTSSDVHFHEKGLTNSFRQALESGRLSIHSDHPARTTQSAHTFVITVGTPIKNDEIQTLAFENAVKSLKLHLRDGDTIISRSTMGIGMTRSLLLEQIADFSNCKVAVCPERTVEGNALNELAILPQLVGGDSISKKTVFDLFNLLDVECIDAGSLEQVEFIKLMTNTYRDSQFAIANEFAMFAEDLGLCFNEIAIAAKQGYERMESLKSQGPSSGPCLSKDPIIMSASSKSARGKSLRIVESARETNKEISHFAIERVLKSFSGLSRFGILGLAFKGIPETDDTRDSFAYSLILELLSNSQVQRITSFDPVNSVVIVNDPRFKQTRDIGDVLNDAECVFISNNHPYFSSPEFLIELQGSPKHPTGVIYDFWDNLKVQEIDGWKVMKFGGTSWSRI